MRHAEIIRQTAETDIALRLELDGTGQSEIDSGVGFLDHMLTLLARHGRFDLKLTCRGDTSVDDHHSVEDIGICLGRAFAQALGEKRGISRYGFCALPMDEALVMCALDLCGRPYLVCDLTLDREKVGDLETEMVREFFYAVSYGAAMNLHIRQMSGANNHHIIEAAFKAFARALDAACAMDPRVSGVLSTKGSL